MKTSVDKIFCEYDEEASAFSSSSFENYFLWVSKPGKLEHYFVKSICQSDTGCERVKL